MLDVGGLGSVAESFFGGDFFSEEHPQIKTDRIRTPKPNVFENLVMTSCRSVSLCTKNRNAEYDDPDQPVSMGIRQ